MNDSPKQGMGCFAKGCLTVVIVFVLLAGITFGGLYYYAGQAVDKLTSSQPSAIRVEQPTDVQYASATTKRNRMAAGYQSGKEEVVELTATDLNALIARHPDFASARGKVFFTIADGNFGAETSIPLDAIPWSRLKGRYLNGKVVAFFEWNNGEATLKPKSIEANGTQVPSAVLSQFDTPENQRKFNQEFLKDAKTRDAMSRLKSVRIVGDKVIVTTKAGAPK